MRLKVTKFEKRDRHWRDREEKVRVYIFPEGEGVFDNLVNRHDRPHKLYRAEVMPKVLKRLGLKPTAKYRWSQKCGCSCGCSPGFIISGDHRRLDVYVTVTAADQEGDADAAKLSDKPDQVRRVSRAASLAADPTLPVSLTPEAMAFMEEVENATS